jgi:hypothetical protein
MIEPTKLTLSEVSGSTGQSVRGHYTADPAYRIEELLELAERARLRGYVDLADEYTDRVIDEVWGPVL